MRFGGRLSRLSAEEMRAKNCIIELLLKQAYVSTAFPVHFLRFFQQCVSRAAVPCLITVIVGSTRVSAGPLTGHDEGEGGGNTGNLVMLGLLP